MQYNFPSQRKLHVNGNSASWMLLYMLRPQVPACFGFTIVKNKESLSEDTYVRYP